MAISEIYKELKRVQNFKINQAELKTIKNYLKGSFLNYFENVLAQSELVRSLTVEGGVSGYIQLLDGINDIKAEQLQDVANKYLQPKDLTLITVG